MISKKLVEFFKKRKLKGIRSSDQIKKFDRIHYFDQNSGAVDINDAKVAKYIDVVLEELKRFEPPMWCCSGSGNTMILGTKNKNGDISIYVTKNYIELNKDKEKEM